MTYENDVVEIVPTQANPKYLPSLREWWAILGESGVLLCNFIPKRSVYTVCWPMAQKGFPLPPFSRFPPICGRWYYSLFCATFLSAGLAMRSFFGTRYLLCEAKEDHEHDTTLKSNQKKPYRRLSHWLVQIFWDIIKKPAAYIFEATCLCHLAELLSELL